MSVGSDAAELIKNGFSPSEVAKRLCKTDRIPELKRLILNQVGEGRLLLSEIYFSIPEASRRHFEECCDDVPKTDQVSLRLQSFFKRLEAKTRDSKGNEFPPDYGLIDCDLYLLSKDSPYTDTYRFLLELETTLHRLIRKTLELAYPEHDDDWWDQGVPLEIRETCVQLRERETQKPKRDSYYFTTFIDLKKIIDKRWEKFREVMPADIAEDGKKKQLMDEIQKANEIRNLVMHPIKGIKLSQANCKFVRELAIQLSESRWQPQVRRKKFGET